MIISFRSSSAFRKWLVANHDKSDGIWLRIFKKNSDTASITYAEALDEAICFGWIDGQKQKHDDESWLQKFTRRRARSGWSRIKAGRMKPPGHAEVDAAKKDGRWKAAYDSPSNAAISDDFLAALSKDAKAKAFFDSLNKANLYAISYRLQTAKKAETRQRRMEMILGMLARGEAFH